MIAVAYLLAALGAAGCVLAIVAELRRRAVAWEIAGLDRSCRRFMAERDAARAEWWRADMELDAIRSQRSQTTRRGNATRAARQRALAEATTAELRRNVAERAAA